MKSLTWSVIGLLLSVLASGCSGQSSDPANAAPASPTENADGALNLIDATKLSDRLIEYTFETQSLNADFLISPSGCCTGQTKVRVLMPRDYEQSGDRRYPVLYLLHGGTGNYRNWTDEGNAEEITEPFPFIVVMPDAGLNGFYTDWYNHGAFGPPLWETYHLFELRPWIEENLRAIPNRNARAVAGLSVGGFGAMSYAARHPDLFVSASSYSGTLDIKFDFNDGGYLDSGVPLSIWGPRETEEVRWRTHNPVDIAENLGGLHLEVRTRNGLPRLVGTAAISTPDPVETGVYVNALTFHNKLDELGIPHEFFNEGAGCHCWEYWQRDLLHTLNNLQDIFAAPPAEPIPFNFMTARPEYEVYGWEVRMERTAMEFSRLSDVRPSGFTLEGSGEGLVNTAPWYQPDQWYEIATSDQGAYRVRADSSGRLSMRIPLGPANDFQQYTLLARLTGTQVFKTSVTVTEVAR